MKKIIIGADGFYIESTIIRRGHGSNLTVLTLVISEAESNIENIRAQESDRHHFHVDVTISVRKRSHLARILRKIRKCKDVIRVVRHKPH